MEGKKLIFYIFIILFVLTICGASSAADTSLNATKGSYDICGLDSNKPTTGPDAYLIQIHVTNNGSSEAQNVISTLQWTGGQNTQYIDKDPNESYTKNIGNIAPNSTKDVFYLIHIDPTAPQDKNGVARTFRSYNISITGDNTVNPVTITGTLQVVGILSQSRNNVLSITPSNPTPYTGDVFTIDILGQTSSSQYVWANFPIIAYNPKVIEPIGYSVQAWEAQTPSNILFTSNDLYTTQTGCNRFHSVWTFKAVSPGTSTVEALIVDQEKGASIHYNNDFSTMITTVKVPSLKLTKTGEYIPYCGKILWKIYAKNDANSILSNVVVNDIINSTSLTVYWNYYVSYNNGISWIRNDGTYNPTTGNWTINQLPVGATYILALYATPLNGTGQTYTNTATSIYDNIPLTVTNNVYIPDNVINMTQTGQYFNNQIVWTINVTNTGRDSADFVVWDQMGYDSPGTSYNNYQISYDGGITWVQDGKYDPTTGEWDIAGLDNTKTFMLRIYAIPSNGLGKTYSNTAVDNYGHESTSNVTVPT